MHFNDIPTVDVDESPAMEFNLHFGDLVDVNQLEKGNF
jgi:hypothetical protein